MKISYLLVREIEYEGWLVEEWDTLDEIKARIGSRAKHRDLDDIEVYEVVGQVDVRALMAKQHDKHVLAYRRWQKAQAHRTQLNP